MKKLLGIAAVSALVAASPARATNGMRMIGFGPVQNSMGGAGAAAPTDAAAVVSNPAGLTGVAPQADVAVQAFMPSVKYTADWSFGPPPAPSGSASQTSSRPTDWLPTLGAVFKVTPDLTVGVAALGTAGMGVTYDAGSSGLYGGKTMSSYLNGRLAPAVAYRLNDQFSVGLALNLMYAQMKFAVSPGAQVDVSPASSFGYGATVGVTYKPIDMVQIGVSYETQSYFQDFSFDVGGGQNVKIKLDQPMVGTVGVAVTPAAGLKLALDGQWINWSAVLGKDKPEVSPSGSGLVFNMNWKDQFVAKLGAEYAIPTLEALKVRAGFNYGKTPVQDTDRALENILFPAIAEMHYTVGAGYDIGKVVVNAAFVYSPEKKISGSNPNQGILAYETKMSQTAFELGGVYKF